MGLTAEGTYMQHFYLTPLYDESLQLCSEKLEI